MSLNITNPADIAEAFNLASKFDNNVLVEKYIPGKDYRVLVINGRVATEPEGFRHGLWRRYPYYFGFGQDIQ